MIFSKRNKLADDFNAFRKRAESFLEIPVTEDAYNVITYLSNTGWLRDEPVVNPFMKSFCDAEDYCGRDCPGVENCQK